MGPAQAEGPSGGDGGETPGESTQAALRWALLSSFGRAGKTLGEADVQSRAEV